MNRVIGIWNLFKRYNPYLASGIYFIPKIYCKKEVKLKENNKTNSLIDKENLIKMMNYSFNMKLFLPIELPENPKWSWTLSKGFVTIV
jgi:hypothetical protein